MDRDKNLWMTQSEVQGSLKVLKPDGTWILNPMTIDAQMIGDLIIARNGYKWVILPRGNGLFVFDDNKTPAIFTDDRSKKMYIEESDGNIFSFVYSVAEDHDGNIWVGTDQGPVVYYNPEKVFTGTLKAYRLRIPRNDGSNIYDYMLSNETITSIAVDGANRKWLGTAGSGAYLLSPDGTLLLRKYTEENSPLLSNSIVSLAVDNKTGDVWFGTSKGIQSVRGDAIDGFDKFTDVYAFPNPVRPEFKGNVTITGLMKDSDIRITDVSGNLVYRTTSSGGEASWDLTTYNGKRVATGVYIAFCASSDGMKSCVVKILVMD
jgi:ligand-binding sensor domain-containing protein